MKLFLNKLFTARILRSLVISLFPLFTVSLASFAADTNVKAGSETLQTSKLNGQVLIDGSSTVYPVSSAAAEEFGKIDANQKLRVKVATSGTGGGFQKFCRGEIDITGASRPIEKSEIEICAQKKITFVELPVAYDGIAVVVNKANSAAKSLTVAQLKKVWEPGSTVKTWGDLGPQFAKDTVFKEKKIKLYGPGPEHGTFDYFTKTIIGKEKSIRNDFNAANPDMIVAGVAGDLGALAYFGFAYYFENKDKLALVAIDVGNGKGPVLPDSKTIGDGTYQPLSRPIFIYVSEAAAKRPEVTRFVDFYLENAAELSPQVGYVALPSTLYPTIKKRFEQRIVGSLYQDLNASSQNAPSLESLLTTKNELQKKNKSLKPAAKKAN